MSLELERAQTITIGTRCYRKYPIKVDLPVSTFKSKYSSEIMYDDDEDLGVEAMPVNDKGNYEDLMQELEEEFKSEDAPTAALVETIFYDPRFKSYTAKLRIGQNNLFYQIFGKVASTMSEQHRYIEEASGAILKPIFKELSVEIRASQPVSTARAHALLLDAMKKVPELRPTEYQVVDERSRKVLSTHKPQELAVAPQPASTVPEPMEEAKAPVAALNDRPELMIRQDKKRNRFTYYLNQIPDVCIRILLKDSGSVMKQIRHEMGNKCDMFVNKQYRRLEFSGNTEDDVKNAYSLVIKTFNTVPEAVAALSSPAAKGYTHFLAMSFMHDPDLVPAVQQILECDIPNRGLVTAPGKLHITMGLLTLSTQEEIQKAKEAVSKVLAQKENSQFLVHFNRLNLFGKATQASVLYLEPENNDALTAVKRLNFSLLKQLIDDELFPESELKSQRIVFDPDRFAATYHLTLVKAVKAKGRTQLMNVQNALSRTTTVDVTARVRKFGLYEMSGSEGSEYTPIVELDA